MVKALVVIAMLAGACYQDRYKCAQDTDCNLGEGGRCETDGFCTIFDADCDAGRRYQHAGDNGSSCYDDAAALANPCAGGQVPARREGCFAEVCDLVPACCEMAWTDACVQLAQNLCKGLKCDTRIALTAVRNANQELWEANWDGTSWQVRRRTDIVPPFAWVGPSPTDPEGEPRLAANTGAKTIVVGDLRFATPADRNVTSISTINFDRDRRDTLVIGSVGAAADHRLDVLKADDDSVRSFPVANSAAVVWGDLDRDTFADAVARTPNNAQYQFVTSRDGAEHERELATTTNLNPGGGATGNAPQVRTYEWMDVDGDTQLDLVMFGSEIRVHTDRQEIREQPEIRADCTPPNTNLTCAADPEPNFEAQSFCGATRPTRVANELVISSFPGRTIYRGVYTNGLLQTERVPFPGDGCACTVNCPGGIDCTYRCDQCIPILAIVVRDLDGDNQLDIVAIDARLNIYHALARTSFTTWVGPTALTTSLPPNLDGFFSVTASVSGAPIP